MVCWYPNFKESADIFQTLSQYAEYIEVQFPFSDPIADGHVIEKANQIAIENGSTTSACFDFVESVLRDTTFVWKTCIMTYSNIVYNYGIEAFIKKCSDIGVYWVIIPDIPYDQDDFTTLYKAIQKYEVHIIQIVSPSTSQERLIQISKTASWCIYAISNNMTTWSTGVFEDSFEKYIKNLQKIFSIPIWVWFWISNMSDVKLVNSIADFSVIWSSLIRSYNNSGVQWIKKFFET